MIPFKGKLRVRHLEIVLIVAELGNLSKAAAQLNTTQSGLSRAIAEIEELVGARLFERAAKGTSCTPLGMAMCRHARQLLVDFRRAEIELAAISRGDEGSLTVGGFSMFAGWPIAPAARRFQAKYPRVMLTIEVGSHEQLIEQLDAGAIDVLISRYSAAVNPQIYRSIALVHDAVILACSNRHPLVDQPQSTLEDYVRYPWITALPGSRIRGELERRLIQDGFSVPDMVGALSPEFSMEMLQGGHYLWLMPGSVAAIRQARGELIMLPVLPPVQRSPLSAIWRRDRPSTRPVRAFSSVLAQAIRADRDVLQRQQYEVF
ncbi:LysR family transcriptional regulator [Bordetella tumbae]|uniref:LysR family transcriptional regulator n=1 Tax=Bordetella tumbae TaxID=1649139 RepID=UPI0039F0F262